MPGMLLILLNEIRVIDCACYIAHNGIYFPIVQYGECSTRLYKVRCKCHSRVFLVDSTITFDELASVVNVAN